MIFYASPVPMEAFFVNGLQLAEIQIYVINKPYLEVL